MFSHHSLHTAPPSARPTALQDDDIGGKGEDWTVGLAPIVEGDARDDNDEDDNNNNDGARCKLKRAGAVDGNAATAATTATATSTADTSDSESQPAKRQSAYQASYVFHNPTGIAQGGTVASSTGSTGGSVRRGPQRQKSGYDRLRKAKDGSFKVQPAPEVTTDDTGDASDSSKPAANNAYDDMEPRDLAASTSGQAVTPTSTEQRQEEDMYEDVQDAPPNAAEDLYVDADGPPPQQQRQGPPHAPAAVEEDVYEDPNDAPEFGAPLFPTTTTTGAAVQQPTDVYITTEEAHSTVDYSHRATTTTTTPATATDQNNDAAVQRLHPKQAYESVVLDMQRAKVDSLRKVVSADVDAELPSHDLDSIADSAMSTSGGAGRDAVYDAVDDMLGDGTLRFGEPLQQQQQQQQQPAPGSEQLDYLDFDDGPTPSAASLSQQQQQQQQQQPGTGIRPVRPAVEECIYEAVVDAVPASNASSKKQRPLPTPPQPAAAALNTGGVATYGKAGGAEESTPEPWGSHVDMDGAQYLEQRPALPEVHGSKPADAGYLEEVGHAQDSAHGTTPARARTRAGASDSDLGYLRVEGDGDAAGVAVSGEHGQKVARHSLRRSRREARDAALEEQPANSNAATPTTTTTTTPAQRAPAPLPAKPPHLRASAQQALPAMTPPPELPPQRPPSKARQRGRGSGSGSGSGGRGGAGKAARPTAVARNSAPPQSPGSNYTQLPPRGASSARNSGLLTTTTTTTTTTTPATAGSSNIGDEPPAPPLPPKPSRLQQPGAAIDAQSDVPPPLPKKGPRGRW